MRVNVQVGMMLIRGRLHGGGGLMHMGDVVHGDDAHGECGAWGIFAMWVRFASIII